MPEALDHAASVRVSSPIVARCFPVRLEGTGVGFRSLPRGRTAGWVEAAFRNIFMPHSVQGTATRDVTAMTNCDQDANRDAKEANMRLSRLMEFLGSPRGQAHFRTVYTRNMDAKKTRYTALHTAVSYTHLTLPTTPYV